MRKVHLRNVIVNFPESTRLVKKCEFRTFWVQSPCPFPLPYSTCIYVCLFSPPSLPLLLPLSPSLTEDASIGETVLFFWPLSTQEGVSQLCKQPWWCSFNCWVNKWPPSSCRTYYYPFWEYRLIRSSIQVWSFLQRSFSSDARSLTEPWTISIISYYQSLLQLTRPEGHCFISCLV